MLIMVEAGLPSSSLFFFRDILYVYNVFIMKSFIKFTTKQIFHYQKQVKINVLHIFNNLLDKTQRNTEKYK